MRALVAMAVALSSATAVAQVEPPPPPGSYGPPAGPGATPPAAPPGAHGAPVPFQHDGLFLRAYLGVGYGRFGSDVPGVGQVIIDGGGAGLSLAAGWTIRPNVILYLELVADVLGQPDVTVEGITTETDGDISVGVVTFGPGLAYYTPTNMYLSGTLGISKLSVTDDNGETLEETEAGLGFSGMLGKEWWLSPTFALGLAGQLFLGSMRDDALEDVTWGAFALTLGVTATYN